jgi:ribokinase
VAWIEGEISNYDMVLLQLEVPIEVNRAVARWAREAGVPVMLNPAPATELDDELLSLVTYLTPNEQEAATETHLPLATDENGPVEADLLKIAAALWRKGVENVIITLGGSGSAVVWNPGAALAAGMGDLGEGNERGFLAVETSVVPAENIMLRCGETHELTTRIQVFGV